MTPQRMAERGIEVHVLPATSTLDEVLARRARRRVLLQRPRRPGDRRRTQVALLRGGARARASRTSASASATSCSAGRSASAPTSCATATAASTSRCMDRATGKVEVTAHNHGFAVDAPLDGADRDAVRHGRGQPRLPQRRRRRGAGAAPADGRLPAFSVQYHPEAAAGPARRRRTSSTASCDARCERRTATTGRA